jgi:hypothetical protein
MRFISPKIHGVIDYLVVLFLLLSPTIFGFDGLIAVFTYALGAVHLILTLLTNFDAGLFKIIPLWIMRPAGCFTPALVWPYCSPGFLPITKTAIQ